MVATTTAMSFNPTYGTVAGAYNYGLYLASENLADLRVSNVARYTGSSYVVPSAPFATDSSTLLLLRSLGGQVGTTLEVQGRGLGSTSIGATQTIRAYPPAPMSSYLLDTTSNASVTYGQGKYVASASSEYDGNTPAWKAFDRVLSAWTSAATVTDIYNTTSPFAYAGATNVVDILGSAYPGSWVQIQVPVSVLVASYAITCGVLYATKMAAKWWLLGSRDGINWTLVDSRTGVTWGSSGQVQTFTVSGSQSYTVYRLVVNQLTGAGGIVEIQDILLNGTEESLCITSDAKVGVGIANPQRALEVAGDLVVSGTISGGAGLGSFRNRIINGDMRIAQRGTSASITSATAFGYYVTDRWALETSFTSGSASLYQNVLSTSDTPYQLGLRYSSNIVVTSAITGLSYLAPQQRIEYLNFQDMNWGTSFGAPVTISLWYKTNIAAGSIIPISLRAVFNGTSYCYGYSTTSGQPNSWQYVSFTVPPPPNTASPFGASTSDRLDVVVGPGVISTTAVPGTWYSAYSLYGIIGQTNIYSQAGNYLAFTGVQLEKGTVATPFEFRPFAQELALCQRYYVRFTGDGSYKSLGVASAFSTTAATGIIVAPTSMRAQPSIIDISSSSNTCAYTSSMIQGTTTHTTNDVYLYSAGVNFGFTTIGGTGNGVASPSYNLIGINLTNGSGITTGWSGMMYLPIGKYIGFSAEL
jgi:hypothetical protein